MGYILRRYNGVLDKEDDNYILYNQKCENNITEALKKVWKTAKDAKIIITTKNTVLANECNCEIYLDRNRQRDYKYHINGLDIEDILEGALHKQLYIELGVRKDTTLNDNIAADCES